MIYFFDNLILGIALTLPPGPVTIEVLRRGLKNGFWESLKTVIGAFCAELSYFWLIYLGFARFTNSFLIKNILGVIGGLFLIYLSYGNFKDFRKKSMDKKIEIPSGNSFLAGYTITFFNPANFIMWAGIISGFFSQNTSLFTSTAILIGILLSLFCYILISKIGKIWINLDRMKYISLFASIFLLFYGIKIIFNLVSL